MMEPNVTISLKELLELAGADSPTWFDYISLAVTVILGFLSLALAYILYQISQKYETIATEALKDISSLSLEVKQKVELGLLSHSDMSNKMLDKLLESNYGSILETSDGNPAAQSDLIIHRISEMLELKLSKIQNEGGSIDLKKIKEEIKLEIEQKKEKLSSIVSNSLFRKLVVFTGHPANFILLDSIMKRNLGSADEVDEILFEDSIPDGAESGIEKLLIEGLLLGDLDSFEVNSEYYDELNAFFEVNRGVIQKLRKNYLEKRASESPRGRTAAELKLGESIKF